MYKPNYTIMDKLLGEIAEIESYRAKVDSSYILPEREIEMRYRQINVSRVVIVP